ncbi:DUF4190 domain-containing protein [Nocardioides albus]|uniref:DUF4190 domain-containing protein n=1 Tax=Nocardioides albus TaxID=1841 RepID=A0A7W5A440_9ACTN|nr:DUF4190 domain-containing protein [Nocardioides albus]MBB3089338.1 hypothetical protein [Nocardioides albus]GGU12654.1 hypothetical protein GCM10007979_08490 [Nocardioides albus]
MSYGTPPPPPQYGAAPGYAQAGGTSGMAIASLILGIFGFICCTGFVFSILAIVFAIIARKDIAASGGAKGGAGMATAGLVLGIVAMVIGIIYWLLVVVGVIPMTFNGERIN